MKKGETTMSTTIENVIAELNNAKTTKYVVVIELSIWNAFAAKIKELFPTITVRSCADIYYGNDKGFQRALMNQVFLRIS
jgi:hypothetical protein